jgi:hypothetical protein
MNSPAPENNPSHEHVWERGWEEHEQLQLERMARLSMAQKLAWLEEAHRVVLHMQAARQNLPVKPSV